MRLLPFITASLVFATLVGTIAPPAQAQGACQRLWVERNSIYKDAGYCFKTERAIRYFGNAGCSYDDQRDVPLSSNDRRRIADIVAEERDLGCR